MRTTGDGTDRAAPAWKGMHSTPTAAGVRTLQPPPDAISPRARPAPNNGHRLVISLEDGAVIEDTHPSFDEVYVRVRPEIARALALSLGDVDLAQEATDEALARAYERWPTVSRLERPEGWIYRVAMNWALSILRRRRRSQHRLYEPDETSIEIGRAHV